MRGTTELPTAATLVNPQAPARLHASGHSERLAAQTVAAGRADLVVVGSRGLRGLRALGSVSERVADGASCSTLVVREPIWQRVAEELGR
jgi:nucleotide-binding universal stress UspA family protein